MRAFARLPVIVGAIPCLVRIIAFHRRSDLGRIQAQILLIDDTVVADDEGLHPGDAIVGRPSDDRKSAEALSRIK